jgi:mannose-6-phosphate isomerase-like protein (cupin superfamily)
MAVLSRLGYERLVKIGLQRKNTWGRARTLVASHSYCLLAAAARIPWAGFRAYLRPTTETAGTYSISEWWMEPNTKGPGAHAHDEDHAYYVLEGTMSVSLDGKWTDCPKGSFILIPGGTTHDFENRSKGKAGILSFNNRAGFENQMPAIVNWFAANPPGNAL